MRPGEDGLFEIDLRIVPRNATDYRTTLVTAVPADRVAEVAKGRTLRVRVDPTRPGGPILVL